jgi:predicted O-methyltransferase YrrM
MVDRWRNYGEPGRKDPCALKTQEEMNEALLKAVDATQFAADRRIIMDGDSVAVAQIVKPDLLDFVFIDAGHDYNSVLRDVWAWSEKVRDKGLLSGHDYGGAGDRHGRFGVKKAVDEFAKANGYEANVSKRWHIWWIEK